MKNESLPQLVLIEWVDSAQPEPNWRHLDDLPKLEIVQCVSVGWLVGENESVTMLAPNVGDFASGANSQASGFIRIPSVSITRMVKLIETAEALPT